VFEVSLKITDRNHVGEEDFDRTILLSNDSKVPVGRASKTENKSLVPAPSNAWIRNPVISRTHAELSVSDVLGSPLVHIQDVKSSHGTFVNGHNIKDRRTPLATGNRLQFGDSVTRGTGKSSLHVPRILECLPLLLVCTPPLVLELGLTPQAVMSAYTYVLIFHRVIRLLFSSEVFRPPVFDVTITKMPRPTLPGFSPRSTADVQNSTFPAKGRTFSQPAESDESDAGSDIDSEAESDKESVSSVLVISSGPAAATAPAPEVLGSQANPWMLEEVTEIIAPTVTIDLTDAEVAPEMPLPPVVYPIVEDELSGSDHGSVVSDDEAISINYSGSSSESEASENSEDQEDEDEEEEEDEAEDIDDFLEDECDYDVDNDLEEAVEADVDNDIQYPSESPRYTPNSPAYAAPPQYKPLSQPLSQDFFGQRQDETDAQSIRNNSEHSYTAYSPPLQFNSLSSSSYLDGPFMNGTNTLPNGLRGFKPFDPLHENVGIPDERYVVGDEEHTDMWNVQGWAMQPPAPVAPWYEQSAAARDTNVPITVNNAVQPATCVTTSTREIIMQTGPQAKSSNKNDMSIYSLINPPAEKSTGNAGKKRKAEELDDDVESKDAVVSNDVVPSVHDSEASTENTQEVESTSSSTEVANTSRVIAKPVSKKRKLAYGIRCAALGSVIGMVGTFATMMSLPDSIFQ
jgi:hypothetical protein